MSWRHVGVIWFEHDESARDDGRCFDGRCFLVLRVAEIDFFGGTKLLDSQRLVWGVGAQSAHLVMGYTTWMCCWMLAGTE
jgi:hypothetical protein